VPYPPRANLDASFGDDLDAARLSVIVGFRVEESGVMANLYIGVHLMDHLNRVGKDAVGNHLHLAVVLRPYLEDDLLQTFVVITMDIFQSAIRADAPCPSTRFGSRPNNFQCKTW